MPVAILGQIRTIQTGVSSSQDKTGRIQFVFNVRRQEDSIDALNRLIQGERGVYAVFFDEVEYEKIKEEEKVAEPKSHK